jgi:hypothetical protein
MPEDHFIRQSESMRLIGVKKTSWHELKKQGLLPVPISIPGVRGVFYSYLEMQELQERLKAARFANPALESTHISLSNGM